MPDGSSRSCASASRAGRATAPSGPLLERELELAAFARAISRAEDGLGTVVLLAGEAGIGKTSLLRAAGIELVGRCEPLVVAVPLAPFHDLLDDVTDVPSTARALLERSPGDVLALEDLHWADEATLDVLRIAGRRWDRVPSVLVLTYRDDETSNARVLAGDLAGLPHVVRLQPRPLSVDAVQELAGSAADRILATTGGNPFLVVESLAADGRVPATVRDAVLARTTRLSPAARGALDVAAVIGQSVEVGLLRRVADAETEAVDACVAAGILVADAGGLTFRHELIRAAVAESIAPARRVQLHAAVARRLAAQPAADHARIAHHAALGEETGLVVEHAAAAADDAFAAGAVREALAQRERVLEHDRSPDALLAVGATAYLADRPQRSLDVLDEARRVAPDAAFESRVCRHLARTYWLLDRWSDADAAARRAVELAEAAADPDEIALATSWLAAFLALGAHSPEALTFGARAVEAATAAGNLEALAAATISIGLYRGLNGDAAGLEQIGEGRALAIEHGMLHQTIRGYVNALVVATILRDYAAADALYPSARDLFESRFLHGPLDDITQSYARSLLDRGRIDDAVTALAAAPRENMVEGILTDGLDALVRVRRGEPGAAEILDRALARVAGARDGFREGVTRIVRAEAAWHAGDLDAARAEAERALAIPTMRRNPWLAGELAVWLVRAGGDVPEADVAEPFGLELAGRYAEAAAAWHAYGCPFDAALAALRDGDDAARAAVATLHRIGAAGSARAFSRARTELGLRAPRGPRSTTDALGLTARERDVLDLVAAGKRNSEIASALHITEKTAGHHVSACLRKLGVRSRAEAAAAWTKMGSSPDVGAEASSYGR